MVTTRWIFSVAAFALGVFNLGCDATIVDLIEKSDAGGDSDSDSDSDTDSDTDTDADSDSDTSTDPLDQVRARIIVPEGFSATPVRIAASFYANDQPSGPPDGEGASYPITSIPVWPSPPYELVTLQPQLNGPYFLFVNLFVEGGGSADNVPVPFVDWVGRSAVPLGIGPGTGMIDAGQIHLEIAQPL